MGDLTCEDCGLEHDRGLTGISENGEATCLDCGGRVTAGGEADG